MTYQHNTYNRTIPEKYNHIAQKEKCVSLSEIMFTELIAAPHYRGMVLVHIGGDSCLYHFV